MINQDCSGSTRIALDRLGLLGLEQECSNSPEYLRIDQDGPGLLGIFQDCLE